MQDTIALEFNAAAQGPWGPAFARVCDVMVGCANPSFQQELNMQKSSQRGMGLMGLIVFIALAGFIGITGLRSLPAWNEYFSIVQAVNSIESSGDTSVASARKTFEKFAEVNRISSIQAADIHFALESGRLNGSFEYESRVPLVGNMSLLFNFKKK